MPVVGSKSRLPSSPGIHGIGIIINGLVIPDMDKMDVDNQGKERGKEEEQCAYFNAPLLSDLKRSCPQKLLHDDYANFHTDPFRTIQCPGFTNRFHDEDKYIERANNAQCEDPKRIRGGQYTRSYHFMMQWAGGGH